MELLCFFVVLVMAVRCISFGISVFAEKNIVGGIAVTVLAVGSVVCGVAVFY